MLVAVEQVGVELVVDFDVTRQAQQVLFDTGQCFDFAVHAAQQALDVADGAIERLHAGVFGGVAGFEFFAFGLEVKQLDFQVDALFEVGGGFAVEVKGAFLGAELVELGFRGLELCFELGQLGVEEGE